MFRVYFCLLLTTPAPPFFDKGWNRALHSLEWSVARRSKEGNSKFWRCCSCHSRQRESLVAVWNYPSQVTVHVYQNMYRFKLTYWCYERMAIEVSSYLIKVQNKELSVCNMSFAKLANLLTLRRFFPHCWWIFADWSFLKAGKVILRKRKGPFTCILWFIVSPITLEPRCNEGPGPGDWQNLFSVTRFRYMEVLFHIFYYYGGKENRSLYRGLRYSEVSYIEVPLYCIFKQWKTFSVFA